MRIRMSVDGRWRCVIQVGRCCVIAGGRWVDQDMMMQRAPLIGWMWFYICRPAYVDKRIEVQPAGINQQVAVVLHTNTGNQGPSRKKACTRLYSLGGSERWNQK